MEWLGLFPRHRITFSRLFALLLIVLLLGTQEPIWASPQSALVAYWLGFVLIIVCMLGRLWSLLFLSGYKTRQVVEAGPFSVVRNPLYGFSLLGALGLALVANHLWLALALLGAFLAYYPFVVLSEERGLRGSLGKSYEDYCRRVPRFWPRLSLFKVPETWEVRLRSYHQAWRDAFWFPLAFLLLSLLKRLQESGHLPLKLWS